MSFHPLSTAGHDKPFYGLRPPVTGQVRWLYVDFNSFFASVEQQLNPALRGKPVIVVPVMTDATCAIAASYEAKAYGIKTGTPVHEARRKCPDLVCVLADHAHYVHYHNRILEEIDRITPVTMACSIDEVACRLMKREMAPDAATQLAHDIKTALADTIGPYIKCSIGIAQNRYLAKTATDLKKPDGLTLLMDDDVAPRLKTLALNDLTGIGHGMSLRLSRAGIYTVEDLLRLSPKHMRAVWGNVGGERMWYLLRGYELPEEKTERHSIGHSHVLPPELRPARMARDIARRLTVKAATRLRRIDYAASGMSLSVRLQNGDRFAEDMRFPTPCTDNFSFLEYLETMWQTIIRATDTPYHHILFKKVSVTLHHLHTASGDHYTGVQGDLFASGGESSAPAEKQLPSPVMAPAYTRIGAPLHSTQTNFPSPSRLTSSSARTKNNGRFMRDADHFASSEAPAVAAAHPREADLPQRLTSASAAAHAAKRDGSVASGDKATHQTLSRAGQVTHHSVTAATAPVSSPHTCAPDNAAPPDAGPEHESAAHGSAAHLLAQKTASVVRRTARTDKRRAISDVMSEINQTYGRDTITIGLPPAQSRRSFSGTKIAFSRIPDAAEFWE